METNDYLMTNCFAYFQYGWAASQKLPVGGFRWVHGLTVEDIINFDPESDIGYFVEVDCHVPDNLHDYMNDLLIFPESLEIDETMASFYTYRLSGKDSMAPDSNADRGSWHLPYTLKGTKPMYKSCNYTYL